MCGIAGIFLFSNSNEEISESLLVRMNDTMVHRGPDGAGTWFSDDKRIGLTHRRLSIIDLSINAAQPMCNSSSSVVISFNGEIYNHADIRKELEYTGKYLWKTDHSDTEVILHAYEEWGIECINRFRGMFALAIWDENKRELFLVRDRMGVKPLYYTVLNDRIIFSSEIKAILEDSQVIRKVNEEALFHYFTFLYVPAPLTLFDGIKKLCNATFLCIKENGLITEKRYWDALDQLDSRNNSREDDLAKQLIDILRESVKLRGISDVPVGVFLSGGIDSSTNASLFAESTSDLNTFSIAYDRDYDSSRSELEYAKEIAKRIGATYHEKIVTEDDLINFLPLMVYLQDEPIADPVCIPTYYVSKLARENGMIVCQVGEGADELYCGYHTWITRLNAQRISRLPIPRVLRKILVFVMDKLGFDSSWKTEYLRRDAAGLPIFWGGSGVYTDRQKFKILSPRMKKKFRKFSSWDAISHIRNRFLAKRDAKDDLLWMTYLDLNSRLPDLLLMRVDKMSMGVSIECRVPFLDQEFVKFSMSIPDNLKTKNGKAKVLLKRAVRGVIPDEIIDRKKQGFSAPIPEWLNNKLGKIVENEVKYFCENTDFLDWDNVKILLDMKNEYLSWQLLNLALWWRTFIENDITKRNLTLIK
jgi:asparagine synthase (glutamine-hydrolysing)